MFEPLMIAVGVCSLTLVQEESPDDDKKDE